MLKGAYFGAKTKTFEDYSFLTNTPYPGKEIRRISAKSSQVNAYSQFPIRRIHLLPYVVKMDDLNITMEEYIRLEEEKALSRAIVLDDTLTSREELSWEPTVSPLNDNKIDFRISFDESDDEDYTVIYDENSFFYKIIFVDNLKTDSENDNDKVNVPSFPSPEPEVSYSNNLDFFKDFDNEFPAIVYNDALTSKSDFLTIHTEIEDMVYFKKGHVVELRFEHAKACSNYFLLMNSN
ncbi:hypothetical protein Tco_0925769 [Tanacetum coccineum]|uniref:Uncharacterized protein n=1 Tax=Tanacetum coccineum TaxID=301880 RepID=A0ABQ5D913_9ASTR